MEIVTLLAEPSRQENADSQEKTRYLVDVAREHCSRTKGPNAGPHPNAHARFLGKPAELLAWEVPAGALVAGANTVKVALLEGKQAVIVFLDLAAQ